MSLLDPTDRETYVAEPFDPPTGRLARLKARAGCRSEPRSGVAGPAQALELAPEALARPALPADDLDRRSLVPNDRRAVVQIAGRGDRGSDTRLDRPDDLDDALAVGDACLDPIACPNLGRRLRGRSVDQDVAALAQLRRERPGLHQAHRAQPAIDSRFVRSTEVSHASKDRTDRGGISALCLRSRRSTGWRRPLRLRPCAFPLARAACRPRQVACPREPGR
jgi:hypothetical protein